jgi:hypothetical protein
MLTGRIGKYLGSWLITYGAARQCKRGTGLMGQAVPGTIDLGGTTNGR